MMAFNDLLFYSIKLLLNIISNRICQQTIFSNTRVTKYIFAQQDKICDISFSIRVSLLIIKHKLRMISCIFTLIFFYNILILCKL